MTYPDAISKGFMLGIFIAISVGPTLFAVIRHSLHSGVKAGIAFVLGVSLSDIIYVVLANVANQYVKFLTAHEKAVSFVGAGIFLFFGLLGLFYKPKPKKRTHKYDQDEPEDENALAEVKHLPLSGYLKLSLSGFLMNALNPAVVVLWLSSLTISSVGAMPQRIVFYAVCLVFVLSMDVLKVFLADKIRQRLTIKTINLLNKISAALVIILGVALLIKALMMK